MSRVVQVQTRSLGPRQLFRSHARTRIDRQTVRLTWSGASHARKAQVGDENKNSEKLDLEDNCLATQPQYGLKCTRVYQSTADHEVRVCECGNRGTGPNLIYTVTKEPKCEKRGAITWGTAGKNSSERKRNESRQVSCQSNQQSVTEKLKQAVSIFKAISVCVDGEERKQRQVKLQLQPNSSCGSSARKHWQILQTRSQ
ncbi:uncharacterized protein V6R79_006903 [Siganus canaliculatus]